MKLSSFKKWFATKTKQSNESLPDNNIQFSIDKNQEAQLKIIVTDTSEAAAEQFADMLFGIMNNEYTENILQILADIGSQDKLANAFVKRVFSHWTMLEKVSEEKFILEPEIKPTSFFRGSKNDT